MLKIASSIPWQLFPMTRTPQRAHSQNPGRAGRRAFGDEQILLVYGLRDCKPTQSVTARARTWTQHSGTIPECCVCSWISPPASDESLTPSWDSDAPLVFCNTARPPQPPPRPRNEEPLRQSEKKGKSEKSLRRCEFYQEIHRSSGDCIEFMESCGPTDDASPGCRSTQ